MNLIVTTSNKPDLSLLNLIILNNKMQLKVIMMTNNLHSDPLNLRDAICGVSQERKILVQSLEMINGRVAMLATVGFALQEAYTGTYSLCS